MLYMTMVKHAESSVQPPQALFDAIGKLIEDQKKSGVLVSAGGLMPTSQSARVRIKGDKLVVTDGPFTEAKEVVGGFSILKADSLEEVVSMTKAFMDLHIKHWPGWEGECEIRPMIDAL